MKIPQNHLDLAEIGYTGYSIDVPRSVTEGWIYDFQKQQASEKAAALESGKDPDQAEATRASMLNLLELVTDWNLDDDAGKVLPLISKTKGAEARAKIISVIPLDVLLHVTKKVTGGMGVDEVTKDLSSAS